MGYKTVTMPSPPDLATLLRMSLLAGLDAPSMTRLHSLLECGQVNAGDCIRPRGDKTSALFIIDEGHVQLKMAGSPKPVADLHRGDSFGLLSLLFPGEACIEAYAAESTKLIVLDASTLRMLEVSNPQLALLIMRSIRQQLAPIINKALPVISRICLD